jgi:hypothetical protein
MHKHGEAEPWHELWKQMLLFFPFGFLGFIRRVKFFIERFLFLLSLPSKLRCVLFYGATDIPSFGKILRELFKKPGGALECLSIGGIQTKLWVGKIQFLLAAGNADIEEAAFLFQGVLVFQ